jgi:capsular polysaccharide biosynthesis protein
MAVLTAATAPTAPTSPSLPLNVALSLALGTVLGVAFALLRELLDRRVRSAFDLFDAAEVPVLGMLEDTSALSKAVDGRKKRFLRRPRLAQAVREPTLG